MKLPVTVSQGAPRAGLLTSRASVQLFPLWHIKSGHTQTTERVELREQKFNYCFRYLLYLEDEFSAIEDAIVYLHTFWFLQRDDIYFQGK